MSEHGATGELEFGRKNCELPCKMRVLTCSCLLCRDGCQWSGWHQRPCLTESTHTRATCKSNFSYSKSLKENMKRFIAKVFAKVPLYHSNKKYICVLITNSLSSHFICAQVVVWRTDVGDLHAGRLPVPWYPCWRALQAAEGRTPHGQTL